MFGVNYMGDPQIDGRAMFARHRERVETVFAFENAIPRSDSSASALRAGSEGEFDVFSDEAG